MTIDTSQIFFSSGSRNYLIIDAPGHKEFIRNMVTGASYAEAALLLADATEGIMAQTRRHVHLLSIVGIKELCVVVNKMDLVGFDQTIFDGIVAGMAELLSQVGIAQFTCVPTSALHGINVAKKGSEMAWYSGPTLLEALDTLRFKPFTLRSLRFPVQDVYDMDDGPVLVGRVESGEVFSGFGSGTPSRGRHGQGKGDPQVPGTGSG
jgi:sulfate adenylyltransferase subunit 1 (EFTu-like GTPase family)